jgi:protein-tyrosine phosphatase
MSKRETQNKIDSIRRSIRADEIVQVLHGYILDGAEYDEKRADKALKLLEFYIPKLKSMELSTDPEGITIQWKS